MEAKGRLGRHRWVVERTLARLKRFRRLAVRLERRADIHYAFPTLACCPVRHRHLTREICNALLVSVSSNAFAGVCAAIDDHAARR